MLDCYLNWGLNACFSDSRQTFTERLYHLWQYASTLRTSLLYLKYDKTTITTPQKKKVFNQIQTFCAHSTLKVWLSMLLTTVDRSQVTVLTGGNWMPVGFLCFGLIPPIAHVDAEVEGHWTPVIGRQPSHPWPVVPFPAECLRLFLLTSFKMSVSLLDCAACFADASHSAARG